MAFPVAVEGQPNTGGVMSLTDWAPDDDAWRIAATHARRCGRG